MSVLISEQIEKIRELTNQDKSAKEITEILNLPEEYPMIAYYRRKFSGEIRKKITKAQERIIQSKAELLEELTSWLKQLKEEYNESKNETDRQHLRESIIKTFYHFTNLFRGLPSALPENNKPSIVSREDILKWAPIVRELTKGNFANHVNIS
jgi:molybdopterin converting factor small subunit